MATFSAAPSNDLCRWTDPSTGVVSYLPICAGTGKMESSFDSGLPVGDQKLYDNRVAEVDVSPSLVEPGDAIVYGPGTGWHTALVVEAGHDPLTISMGQQGDPSLVRVSQDGRQPQRYLRFRTEGTLRTPADLDKPTIKVATPDLTKTAPHVEAPVVHPEPHQTAPEAPHAEATHQTVDHVPATGFPLLGEIEHLVKEVIEGPSVS